MRIPFNIMLGVCAIYAAMLISTPVQAQNKTETIPYGANPAAGHYLSVDDAKIYYETYGSGGTPLVLLHGGLYGYIEEFGELIGEMSKHRRVIAIATRGHGRSDLGTKFRRPSGGSLRTGDGLQWSGVSPDLRRHQGLVWTGVGQSA